MRNNSLPIAWPGSDIAPGNLDALIERISSATQRGSEMAFRSSSDRGMGIARPEMVAQKANPKKQANQAGHRRLLILVIAVILLGTSGVAAVMTWKPSSVEDEGVVSVPDKRATSSARAVGTHVRMKCAECGVVVSTREIRTLSASIQPGSTGGDKNGERNNTAAKPATSSEVTVHMLDGSIRVLISSIPTNWRPGERMILIEGASPSND